LINDLIMHTSRTVSHPSLMTLSCTLVTTLVTRD